MITKDQIKTLLDGGIVVDESGDKVGKIGQVYLDDESGNPEWVTASTGLFGTSETFIPIQDAETSGSQVRVPYSKDRIKDAPRMEVDDYLSREQESELYRYYQIKGHPQDQHAEMSQEADVAQGTDRANSDAHEQTMTRSEEQVHVGTEQVASGKARLRKYVVTEDVTTTVPVSHEEVHLEREPITEADRNGVHGGSELSEEDQEVTLTEERVVVSKETVPVEQVRMDTETVTEDQQVTEQVRKEQIDTDLPDSTDTSAKDKPRRNR